MIKIPKAVNVCDDKYVCWGKTEFSDFARDSEDVVFKMLNASQSMI